MSKGIITLCEVGILLPESHKVFNNYNKVWNRKFGFYNEADILYKESNTKDAILYAKEYVKTGIDMTYAIVSNEGECVWEEPFDNGNLEIISRYYDTSDVIYSVAKINGVVIEDFLELEKTKRRKI